MIIAKKNKMINTREIEDEHIFKTKLITIINLAKQTCVSIKPHNTDKTRQIDATESHAVYLNSKDDNLELTLLILE